MTLNVQAVLRVEAAQAKAELEAARRGVEGVTTATEAQTRSSRNSTTATNAATAATGRAAQANRTFAVSQGQAAAATGNLVANFNDIGVMLAAGQNPLQLAIQQGTQITQVIGGQGAAGAAALLKTAFFQMLNPINLLTVGVIAAGAAAIQWLTGATENALTLEQQIEAVNDAIAAWRDESAQSLDDLRERFGAITPEIIEMQRELSQLRIAQILNEADAAARQLAGTMGEGWFSSTGGDIRRLFGIRGVGSGRQLVDEFKGMFAEIEGASTIGDQLAAVETLRTRLAELTGGLQNMNPAAQTFYQSILETEAALRAAALATGDVEAGMGGALGAAEGLNASIDAMGGMLARMAGISISGIFSDAQGPARGLLGIVNDAASRMVALAQGIEEFGRTNVLMAADGTVYRRGIFQEGGMDAAARGEALKRPNPFGKIAGGAAGVYKGPGSGVGTGGGGGAAAEADALQKLIASLEGEIAALRVQDPLQQELLRHREALTGATDAERAKVEELIATRDREKAAVEGLRSAAQMGGNALIDALMGAEDAGRRLIETLLQAGLQAALLGEGPLAGLFGGGEGGGFLGMLLDSISPVRKASGGMITGPGTATSDSIPAMLSNGEFVVNARATSRNRGLLEAINSGGRILGLAEGGMVGAARQAPGAGGGQRPMVQIINQSSEPIREEQGNGPDAEGTVTLIVGRAMGQGRFDRQQRTRFGLTPKVTAR